jgi:hypothetical protein
VDQADPGEDQEDQVARDVGLAVRDQAWEEPLWCAGTAGCAGACDVE